MVGTLGPEMRLKDIRGGGVGQILVGTNYRQW
jgi:hypothetical protein